MLEAYVFITTTTTTTHEKNHNRKKRCQNKLKTIEKYLQKILKVFFYNVCNL